MNPVLQTVGGFGLFLFGMAVMTSGLKKLAGDRLQSWLARATRTPFSGVVTGAAVTAVIQSSSATTVAAVGFVGAGLMTFSQALGVLFGANIGTTVTGWIVAVVGFKLKLGTLALPLMLVAAVLYLNKSRRLLRGSGKALAGFALIFLGIGYLQEGLAGARDLIDLSAFDATGLSGRLVLLLVGGVLTMITQSSSATVAAALTALNTGVIDVPQAMAAIIGADVGTTATGALATIGGNTGSKRTGFAHVIYNLMTGLSAFLLLPVYLWFWHKFGAEMLANSPEVVAVSFHSAFNALGVLVAIPFTNQFARLIERMFPEREAPMVAALDKRLLGDSNSAVGALETSSRTIASAVLRYSASRLSGGEIEAPEASVEEILRAVAEARAYSVKAGEVTDENHSNTAKLFAVLHMIDHSERLVERASEKGRYSGMASRDDLKNRARKEADEFVALADDIQTPGALTVLPPLELAASELEADRPHFRRELISAAARGEMTAEELDRALDGARWLRRLVFHAWRIGSYWAEVEEMQRP